MKKFEIGERIVVYESGQRRIGHVRRILDDQINLVEPHFFDAVHIKQCRKIAKPEEIWINTYANGYIGPHPSKEEADRCASAHRISCDLYRKVKQK